MNKEFQTLRKKQRFSLRKLNIGVASVLLGFTIFGYNLVSQAPVAHAATTPSAGSSATGVASGSPASNSKAASPTSSAATDSQETPATQGAASVKQTESVTHTTPSAGSSATEVASGSPASNSKAASATSSAANAGQAAPETQVPAPAASQSSAPANSGNATSSPARRAGPTPANHTASNTNTTASAGSGASGSSATRVASGSPASNSKAASATSSAANASQAAPETQVTSPAASQSSAPANSGNATSSPASQAGTVSANHTASNTNTTPSSQTVSVNETTFPAAQSRILMTKFLAAQSRAAQSRIFMTNLAVRNPNTADDLPKSTQTYELVSQPLLTDYLTHLHDGKRDGKTWVNTTVKWFQDSTLDTIFGTTSKSKPGIITSHPDKYFFAAYVDYSTSYHRVILLARSQNPIDHNLYSYTIHTGINQNTSSTTAVPNTDTKEVYVGASGSKYDLIFKNYQGKSYAVVLKDFKDPDYGLLPVFDGGLLDPTYGSNNYDQNDKAAETKSIGFWASAIPQETSTKVRYVDQATGKDIVQPMEISGFGYQGFQVKGDAPTVTGYNLVSKPKFLGLPYEDGTIAPYKVGQTYDLALSDSVVIKQTVI
uniref:YSIRK-type signal peptide-containing protein n=1 Tax=uncultured Lactobacillus sp. TaxID=153152 RepID=UPI0025D651EA